MVNNYIDLPTTITITKLQIYTRQSHFGFRYTYRKKIIEVPFYCIDRKV